MFLNQPVLLHGADWRQWARLVILPKQALSLRHTIDTMLPRFGQAAGGGWSSPSLLFISAAAARLVSARAFEKTSRQNFSRKIRFNFDSFDQIKSQIGYEPSSGKADGGQTKNFEEEKSQSSESLVVLLSFRIIRRRRHCISILRSSSRNFKALTTHRAKR